ncbi:MAG: hypothetical protein HC933_00380 [Pleurocapsa sp. SU_196_0]|nr:hypothetical protein [Pleurocapsa sp. SU_196_0]
MNETTIQPTTNTIPQSRFMKRVTAVKVILVGALLAASQASAQIALDNKGTNNPIDVLKGGFCGQEGINQLLVNGTLLFISLLIGVIVYGWNQRFGNRNAGEGLRNAVIGTLLVAGSTTVAKAFISNGC